MTADLPVDLDRLRDDVRLARERLHDLETLLALGERLYGSVDEYRSATSQTASIPADVRPHRVNDGPLRDLSTRDAALWVFRNHPNEVLTLETITEEMARLGWDNGSETPVSSVRVAVTRAMKNRDPHIHRMRLGHYTYVPEIPPTTGDSDPIVSDTATTGDSDPIVSDTATTGDTGPTDGASQVAEQGSGVSETRLIPLDRACAPTMAGLLTGIAVHAALANCNHLERAPSE